MHALLKNKLRAFLRENNPELLLELQETGKVADYLDEKMLLTEGLTTQRLPEYVIEEHCMQILTADLRPSKFNYLKDILEEEFETVYRRFSGAGILQTELINMIRHCQPVFKQFDFSEKTEDDRQLRYAIIGVLSEYCGQ